MKALPTEEELANPTPIHRDRMEQLCRVRFVRERPEIKITVEFRLDRDPGEDSVFKAEMMEWLQGQAVIVKKTVKPAGRFIQLGTETDEDPFWADIYDGRFGHVYFGHQPYLDVDEPMRFAHATGLDLVPSLAVGSRRRSSK